MRYAIIEDGIVTNIAWISESAETVFENAVKTNDLPVLVGDSYNNGVFYRNGNEVVIQDFPEKQDEEKADMKAALNVLGVYVGGQMA